MKEKIYLDNDGRYISPWNFIPKPLINNLWLIILLYLGWGALGHFYLGYPLLFMVKVLIKFSIFIFVVFSLIAFLINFKIWREKNKNERRN